MSDLDHLHAAFAELERRADDAPEPSVTTVHHRTRWGLVAASAVAVLAVGGGVLALSVHDGSGPSTQAGSRPAMTSPSARTTAPPATSATPAPGSRAARILGDAATALDAATTWRTPAADEYFYVRTTEATTWTSVSGRQAGKGVNSDGVRIWVPGCENGSFSAGSGQDGSCTLNDVPHYRGDAPTVPARWDAYLEGIAPGAKAGGAQGKIIVQVLHQDLISPKATAALLRHTESCSGLRTVKVAPVGGRQLVGVTCTSMAAGSYALVFDADTHDFVGFQVVSAAGKAKGQPELVLRTGIVDAPGQRP
ncbi:hypothetical protein [Jatrophihabitans fulvus]